MSATPVPFGIVGTGWRSDTYVRIAQALPDRFRVTAVRSRDPERYRLVATGGVRAVGTLDDLVATRPAFVVVSVPWAVTPVILRELTALGVPVLSETPPAPELPGLEALGEVETTGARIQVAEQYRFQPMHAARLALAGSGRLGTVTQAQVSVAHGYHGIDLMRRFLQVGFGEATIAARRFTSPIVAGPGRNGPPEVEHTVSSEQLIATFDFGDRLGVLDFTDDQYFSWIRGQRLLVRGDRGEIDGTTVRYLLDVQAPVALELVRRDAGRDGNLEGLFHAGITAGGEWLYRNPFAPARLTDDEIAIAMCLQAMAGYVEGGPAFCSLAEAAHDHYLNLMMERAAAQGAQIRAPGLDWVTGRSRGRVRRRS